MSTRPMATRPMATRPIATRLGAIRLRTTRPMVIRPRTNRPMATPRLGALYEVNSALAPPRVRRAVDQASARNDLERDRELHISMEPEDNRVAAELLDVVLHHDLLAINCHTCLFGKRRSHL